jgi:hypothetical protein
MNTASTALPHHKSTRRVPHLRDGLIVAKVGIVRSTAVSLRTGQTPSHSLNYALLKMKFNRDGSLDIYIQHDSPGNVKESNWLPADAGDFNVIVRIYWPRDSVLNGTWTPPPMKKVD